MAEYSGEKELLGTGEAPDPRRRTGGALPPETDAAKEAAKDYEEAEAARAEALAEVEPVNRPHDEAGNEDVPPVEGEIPPALEEAKAQDEAEKAEEPPPAQDDEAASEEKAEAGTATTKGKAKKAG